MKKTLILVDTSGSMEEPVGDGRSIQRLEALKHELSKIPDMGDQGRYLICSFASYFEVSSLDGLYANGATNLAIALREASALSPGRIIIFSDGLPTAGFEGGTGGDEGNRKAQKDAFQAADEAVCEISTVYIGPQWNGRAIKFMRDLCRMGGKSRTGVVNSDLVEEAMANDLTAGTRSSLASMKREVEALKERAMQQRDLDRGEMRETLMQVGEVVNRAAMLSAENGYLKLSYQDGQFFRSAIRELTSAANEIEESIRRQLEDELARNAKTHEESLGKLRTELAGYRNAFTGIFRPRK